MSYAQDVEKAKKVVEESLVLLGGDTGPHFNDKLRSDIAALNRAWSCLVAALVRQKQKRDDVISDLISELAEAEKP